MLICLHPILEKRVRPAVWGSLATTRHQNVCGVDMVFSRTRPTTLCVSNVKRANFQMMSNQPWRRYACLVDSVLRQTLAVRIVSVWREVLPVGIVALLVLRAHTRTRRATERVCAVRRGVSRRKVRPAASFVTRTRTRCPAARACVTPVSLTLQTARVVRV